MDYRKIITIEGDKMGGKPWGAYVFSGSRPGTML